ncbi:hypothetical protein LE191_03340 [Janthinobacterium sp. HSC-3S05]|uniref:hypothetical protein n=1 Tax=Janthinobacterium lividum TaxID=29581 RepID=UPI001CD910B5|nr:hypothetical protein [Janthinobacterium lividum]MCA1859147.1 hypothetical protein [Janthinobacterium lividum]
MNGLPATSAPQPKQDTPVGVASATSKSNAEQPLVQMSQEWISKNIRIAVKDEAISLDIISKRTKVYSRHLFYTPFYLPSAAAHENALLEDGREKHEKHADHDIPSTHRHDEQEVKAVVNHKHTKIGLAL